MKRLGFLFVFLFSLFCFFTFYYVLKSDECDYEIEYLSKEIKDFSFGCIDEYGNVSIIYLDSLDLVDAISCYTIKQNSLPNSYYSPLGYKSDIEVIQKEEDVIYLKIDKIDNPLMVDEFIECLEITMSNYDFKEINLLIGLSEYKIKKAYT